MITYSYLTNKDTGTSIPGQSGPKRNGNERLLNIPQRSRAEHQRPMVLSYSGHALEVSPSSTEMQSASSTAPADWEDIFLNVLYYFIRLNYFQSYFIFISFFYH